jgi:hypothetical protein
MDCGADDLACQLFDWFSSSGYVIRHTFAVIDSLWDAAGGHITNFWEQHGEKLVAMASFCFGLWRWYVYRERILYKRLEQYIQDSDRRHDDSGRRGDLKTWPGSSIASTSICN